jgi:hypothetical protein
MSARKYAPPQLNFMRYKIRELEELGLVYNNSGAEWASPPLILPMPEMDDYRTRMANLSDEGTLFARQHVPLLHLWSCVLDVRSLRTFFSPSD